MFYNRRIEIFKEIYTSQIRFAFENAVKIIYNK